jgi:hypothetical protein
MNAPDHLPAVEARCTGDSGAMGLAHGGELRDKLVGTHEALARLDAFVSEKPADRYSNPTPREETVSPLSWLPPGHWIRTVWPD